MSRGLGLTITLYWSSKRSFLTELVASYSNMEKSSIVENFISLLFTKRKLFWR